MNKLWKKVLAGNHQAWGNLVRRYSGLVYTVARRVGLSTLSAEDCAQQTWMALYQSRRSIRDPDRLPAWLIVTTKRNAVRMLQTQSRVLDSYDLRHLPVELPDDELSRLERADILQNAMERLDSRCKKLLTALFLSTEDLSYREIAKILNINPNAMGPLRSRCLKRLRKLLKTLK